MIRRAVLLALAVAAAACGSDRRQTGLQLDSPSAVVEARMSTGREPGRVRPYLALASQAGNELRILDPTDNQPVLGPGAVFPLSVPTQPRPLYLAATPLGDGTAAAPRADLLVVASGGVELPSDLAQPAAARTLELVQTWPDATPVEEEGPRVVANVDLGLAQGEVILALAAAPMNGSPGRARVVLALSGGTLASVEFQRGADGSSIEQVPGSLARHTVGFEAVSLAFNRDGVGGDGTLLYCATRDVVNDPTLGPTQGVAEVDFGGAPGTLLRVLRARAGTVAVAWAAVGERAVGVGADPDVLGGASERVYAVLAPEDCGPDRAIDCGLVALDARAAAAGGTGTLLPDLAEEMDYRAPVRIPGLAGVVAVALPPATGSQRPAPVPPVTSVEALLRLAPASGTQDTTAAAAVTSADGNTYLVDLGRWAAPNDVSLVRSTTRVRANAASTATANGFTLGLGQPDPDPAQPGCLDVTPPATATTSMQDRVGVTPGYTRSDTWSLTWQGTLPGLAARRAQVGRRATGEIWVALVSAGGVAGGFDPRLGTLAGDLVEVAFAPQHAALCPNGERAVAAFADAEPLGGAPLGAALLATPDLCAPAEFGADGTDVLAATVTVRSPGLLLTGTATGYAGRPATPPVGQNPAKHLLVYDAAADRGSADPVAPVEHCVPEGDRAACERQLVARRARRFHYPTDRCDATPCPETPAFNAVRFGVPTGPALVLCPVFADAQGARVDPPTDPLAARGATLTFTTQSGVTPTARGPRSVNAATSLPVAAAPVDRSTFPDGADVGRVFYVTYSGDMVYEIGPGRSARNDVALR